MISLKADKSNTLITQKSINIGGRLLDLSMPKVMGIINLTPDSFYQNSRHIDLDDIYVTAEKMVESGATFLDLGGYSSRPGAVDVSIEEEVGRVVPAIQLLREKLPEAYLSVDTFRAEVARQAVDAGANLINDISAGSLDDQMLSTVGALGVPYIGMHMKGTPQTMQQLTDYEDVLAEVAMFFSERINEAKRYGIKDFIIDPGFGFAKTQSHNYKLLNHLDYLSNIGHPILVGVSRKSMIYKALNIKPEDALNGTSVLNAVALLKGASILRVHDVAEASEVVQLINYLQN